MTIVPKYYAHVHTHTKETRGGQYTCAEANLDSVAHRRRGEHVAKLSRWNVRIRPRGSVNGWTCFGTGGRRRETSSLNTLLSLLDQSLGYALRFETRLGHDHDHVAAKHDLPWLSTTILPTFALVESSYLVIRRLMDTAGFSFRSVLFYFFVCWAKVGGVYLYECFRWIIFYWTVDGGIVRECIIRMHDDLIWVRFSLYADGVVKGWKWSSRASSRMDQDFVCSCSFFFHCRRIRGCSFFYSLHLYGLYYYVNYFTARWAGI